MIAVFAPMPRASVSTAIAVKAGFFSNIRTAYFKSFMRAIYDSRLGRGQNTKIQTPNSGEIPSCKPQTAPRYRHIWSLEFGASLGFGFWFLEFSFVSQRLHPFDVQRSMLDVRCSLYS